MVPGWVVNSEQPLAEFLEFCSEELVAPTLSLTRGHK